MKLSAPIFLCLGLAIFSTTVFQPSLSFTPSQRPLRTKISPVVLHQEGKGSFSLANLFGESGSAGPSLRGSNNLEPHPSVRPHISPLNRLGPDEKKVAKSDPLPFHPNVKSGTLPNGLPYIILPNKSPPGRFEAHLQVFSGSGMSLK